MDLETSPILEFKMLFVADKIVQMNPMSHEVTFKEPVVSDGKVGVDVEDERPRHHSNSSDDVSSEGKRDLHYRVTHKE